MPSPGTGRTAFLVAVVCLLTLGVGVAAAHQFVTFGKRPLSAEDDGTVSVPVNFHNTDIGTFRLTGDSGVELAVDLVDTDADGEATLELDLVAVGRGDLDAGVRLAGGALRNPRIQNAPGGPLPAGNYTLTLETPTGFGDDTTLYVSETAASTATATPTATEMAGQTTTQTTNSTATQTTNSTAETPERTETAEKTETAGRTGTADRTETAGSAVAAPADRRASLPLFLLALFGPAIPVIFLAVASRTVG